MHVAIDTTNLLFIVSGERHLLERFCEMTQRGWWIVLDNENKQSYLKLTPQERAQLFTNTTEESTKLDILSELQRIAQNVPKCQWTIWQIENEILKQRIAKEQLMEKLASLQPVAMPKTPTVSQPDGQISPPPARSATPIAARPNGGLTGLVWELCDMVLGSQKLPENYKELKKKIGFEAGKKGINPSTFSVQFGKWYHFKKSLDGAKPSV